MGAFKKDDADDGKSRWHRTVKKVEKVLKDEIRNGFEPRTLCISLALGATIGIWPVFFTSAMVCFFADAAARLVGRPLSTLAIQTANLMVAPLQLLLTVPFLHLGERLFSDHQTPLSPTEFATMVKSDPWHVQALLWHAILGWLVCAPLIFGALFGFATRYLTTAPRFKSSQALQQLDGSPPPPPPPSSIQRGSPARHSPTTTVPSPKETV